MFKRGEKQNVEGLNNLNLESHNIHKGISWIPKPQTHALRSFSRDYLILVIILHM